MVYCFQVKTLRALNWLIFKDGSSTEIANWSTDKLDGISVSDDGNFVIATRRSDFWSKTPPGGILLWSTSSKQPLKEFGVKGNVAGFLRGSSLFGSVDSNGVYIWGPRADGVGYDKRR